MEGRPGHGLGNVCHKGLVFTRLILGIDGQTRGGNESDFFEIAVDELKEGYIILS
jgi:hypothetical protein